MEAKANPTGLRVAKKISRHELGLRVNDLLGHNQQLAMHMAACHRVMKMAHIEACTGYDALNLSILPSDRKNRKRFEDIATLLGPFCVEPPTEEEQEHEDRTKSAKREGQDGGRSDGEGGEEREPETA